MAEQTMRTITYFTQAQLLAAAKEAERTKRNRSVSVADLTKRMIEQAPDTRYPVMFHFLHENGDGKGGGSTDVRCNIAIGGNDTIWLDVEPAMFTSLATTEIEA